LKPAAAVVTPHIHTSPASTGFVDNGLDDIELVSPSNKSSSVLKSTGLDDVELVPPSIKTSTVLKTTDVVLAQQKKLSSAGEFYSLFQKAAAEREKEVGVAHVSVKVTEIIQVSNQFKAILVVSMVDGLNQGYWCFKAEMFGLLYKAVSELLVMGCSNCMSTFKTLFKRSTETPEKIELICSDKSKLRLLNPKVNGNRVICYCVSGDTYGSVSADIDSIIQGIDIINNDDRIRSDWVKSALDYDQFKFSEGLKKATLNDSSFWKILKAKVTVEHKAALDTVLAFVSIHDVVVEFFYNSTYIHPLDWPSEIKAIAFESKTIPPGF
jgi:hypothetical protein